MRTLTILALSAAMLLPSAGAFADQAADAARCQLLRNQFDRYAASAKTEGDFTGRLDRDIGVDLCRRGQYAAGIQELEKAIRLIGFTPY
jgi:hypothetical protein